MKRPILIWPILIFVLFLFFWTTPKFHQYGTVKIWDRNNILLYESAGKVGKKMPVKYEKLPKYLIDATVSSEDSSFWTNPGVDLKAILRSFFINIKSGRVVTGASTLTQQLARALVISPQQIESRSFSRKIREILIAVRLTATYSKKDILTMYLNEMYFGNMSYGIKSAADTYFGKDASQLSLSESAFLVGLISAPLQRDPYTNFDNAKKGQHEVLDLMARGGYISKEKAKEVKGEPINIENKKTNIKAPHFVHYVLEEQKAIGIASDGGINIYTTLDYPAFVLSQDVARLWVKKLAAKHDLTNAALVLLKNDSGEILVMLGGIDYFDLKNAGEVNIATAARQPGSSIKPVTYAAAFVRGETPASLIYDVKKVYKTKKGEGFTPGNYDGQYHGMVLAREALASSFNLPAVEMLNRVGIGGFLKVARDLGISTFTRDDRYDLSLTLGGGEVKLLDLTNVYATLARAGVYKEYFAIQKIVTDQGQTLYLHKEQKGKKVLGKNGPQVAYLISHILSDPKARIFSFGEKNPLVLSHPAAVKTGTTTDWHDNWTVGFTPSYTVGVWVGNNDNHPMKEITGIVGAAPIWNQFFEEFLKDKPKEQFARPEGLVEREICKSSGKLVDGLCPEKATELFIKGTEPKDKSKLHKKIRIDTRNNLLAAGSCPQEFVKEKIFIDYPPEVYTWALQNAQETIPREFSPLCGPGQVGLSKTILEITYPRTGAVFESAPLLIQNQAIVFEANVSSDIKKVLWYVDASLVKTALQFPFSSSWRPTPGKHKIYAEAVAVDGSHKKSEEIKIEVVEYGRR